jgi:hypothetical protein
MDFLLAPLRAILCVLQSMALSVLAVLEIAMNLVIVSVSGYIDLLGAALPDMPDPINPPNQAVLNWVLWIYPLGPALATLLALVGVWLSIGGLRIAMRWVRLL